MVPLIASKITTWTIASAREVTGGFAEVLRTAASNILLRSLTTPVVLIVGLDVRVEGFAVTLFIA